MAMVADAVTQEELVRTPVYFPHGVPGLDTCHSFTLVAYDGMPVYHLVSDDEPGIVLPVADAGAIVEDYVVELSDTEASELGLECAEDAQLLIVLTVPAGLQGATANLLAPIVLSKKTRFARQFILDGSGYSLRQPIVLG